MNDPSEGTQPISIDIPLAKPWMDEEEVQAAAKVLRSGWLISGPETEAFELEFAQCHGVKHAIAVNSGSSALLVAQAALGIGPGDEVVVPNMTFISSASSSLYLGAKPVFAEITLDDYCMDPVDLEKCISSKTRAILPVHFAGQSAKLEPILEIAKKYQVVVIEDAAESHLSKYQGRYTGTWGEISIFSFTPSKPMTTGEGGMIVTNNADLARRAKLIRNFGDTGKFQWDILGFNFRMPEVMGAIGRVQLRRLSETVRLRRKIATVYSRAFASIEGLILPFVRCEEDHNFQLYTLRMNPKLFRITRDEWILELKKKRIAARLYYPTLHDQKVFSSLPKRSIQYSNAGQYAATAFSIPIYPTLSEKEQEHVIQAIVDIATKNRR